MLEGRGEEDQKSKVILGFNVPQAGLHESISEKQNENTIFLKNAL